MATKESSNPYENYELTSVRVRGVSKAADVVDNILGLDIYETLDGFINGVVVINDTVAIIDSLHAMGLEGISMEFASRHGADTNEIFSKSFRIISTTRTQNKPGNKEIIVLKFTNNMMVINEFNKRPYIFQATSISNMIKTILDSFGEETPKYNIEETLYQKSYTSGIARPMDTIFKLSDYASSKDNNSCKFIFYENRDGLQFRSLGSLREQDYKFIIFQGNTNGGEKFGAGESKILVARRISVDEQSDVMQINEGIFGSRTTSHSLIRKKAITSEIKRKSFLESMPLMNKVPHLYLDNEEFQEEMLDSDQPLNNIQLAPHDGFYVKNSSHPLGNTGSVARMEEAYMYAKSITVELPGNTNITVGDVIYVDFTGIVNEGSSSLLASGKWMVNSLHHAIDQTSFMTTLGLIGDSAPDVAVSGISE